MLVPSMHLKVAKGIYVEEVLQKKGKVLFFCVAGQNRSATLALAVLLLVASSSSSPTQTGGRYTLDTLCQRLATVRPFVLENEGFQTQLLQLEQYLATTRIGKKQRVYGGTNTNANGTTKMYAHGDFTRDDLTTNARSKIFASTGSGAATILAATSYDESCGGGEDDTASLASVSSQHHRQPSYQQQQLGAAGRSGVDGTTVHAAADTRPYIEIELLIPGLCTMEAEIPVPSTIHEVKRVLVEHANRSLLAQEHQTIAKSWLVLANFGAEAEYDVPLEEAIIEPDIQHARIQAMFQLRTERRPVVPVPAVSTAAAVAIMATNETTTTTTRTAAAATATNYGVSSCSNTINQRNSNQHNNKAADRIVYWTSKCRFALVIFSVYSGKEDDEENKLQEPWTFRHEVRKTVDAIDIDI